MAVQIFTTIWRRYLSPKWARQHTALSKVQVGASQLLPRDTPEPTIPRLRVLMFCNRANGLSKLVKLHLERSGHAVTLRDVNTGRQMIETARAVRHDIVVCPFLTTRVPREIWQRANNRPCLIVHPGVIGDRGISSLDRAIGARRTTWGVTVLQAEEEMDSGAVWAAVEFDVDEHTTKSQLYNGPVAAGAADAVLEALQLFSAKAGPQAPPAATTAIPAAVPVAAVPLPVPAAAVPVSAAGRLEILKPPMTVRDRRVDWRELSAEQAVRRIRMSDTRPGCRATLRQLDHAEVVLFGGHVQPSGQSEQVLELLSGAEAGDVVGQKDEAVLIKAGDGHGLWVTHMKRSPGRQFLKLPAASVLSADDIHLPIIEGPTSWEEISMSRMPSDITVAMIHFDFYNGAMSTNQCRRLQAVIETVAKKEDVKVIVLEGGNMFFSNGIHLNVIEAAHDPVAESWRNINAMNDVVLSLATIRDKLTVSALPGGAGAGGVMLAIAADLVWARRGVLLTPTYKAMHLYGSEYWTYFLPKRVGYREALRLTNSTESMLSETAKTLGLIDKTFGKIPIEFRQMMEAQLHVLIRQPIAQAIMDEKSKRGSVFADLLQVHREAELNKMAACFQSVEYHNARKAFVYT